MDDIGFGEGDEIIIPLRPQPRGRAQRRTTVGSTASFPRATTMTSSARGGAQIIKRCCRKKWWVEVEGCGRDGLMLMDEGMEG